MEWEIVELKREFVRFWCASLPKPHAALSMQRKKINVSTGLAGRRLGLKEVEEVIWRLSGYAL